MWNDNFKIYIEEHLQNHVKQKIIIRQIFPVSGGSINNCLKLQCDSSSYFIKINDAEKFPSMFDLEKEGLEAIKKSGLRIPEVIVSDRFNKRAFLLMEFIEPGRRSRSFFEEMG